MDALAAVEIVCPYCGETLEIVVDCSIADQRYIEDCQVCCRPINLSVSVDDAGVPLVEVSTEDEA
jgi:hypothetical protein